MHLCRRYPAGARGVHSSIESVKWTLDTFDLYTQAFAKIERSHARDIADVRAMIERKCIELARLEQYVSDMLPHLERYPHLDEASLRAKLSAFVAEARGP